MGDTLTAFLVGLTITVALIIIGFQVGHPRPTLTNTQIIASAKECNDAGMDYHIILSGWDNTPVAVQCVKKIEPVVQTTGQ